MSAAIVEDHSPVLPHEAYANQLRIHAVSLVWIGHQLLDRNKLATAQEDTITGELVRALKRVVQDPSSPEWVDHYEVHEQVRQNVDEKQGKMRPIMDIEIECHRRGARPRLGFEAKRLGRNCGVSDYLGETGMGAFRSGYYSTTHGDAGMLGYIQEHTPAEWSSRLLHDLSENSASHGVKDGGQWTCKGHAPSWASTEHLDFQSKSLFVIHVLLPCC